MKVLVTGGAGFIGSHVVDTLRAAGRQVMVLDNLSTGRSENLNPAAGFTQGDILNRDTVRRLVKDAHTVVHLAAQTSVPESIRDPAASADINILGSLNVLQAAHDFGTRVVFASSAAVYGHGRAGGVYEHDPVQPLSPYGLEKSVIEQYMQLLLPRSTALRFFNVYGPRQSGGVIHAFTTQAQKGSIIIEGDGNQTRDFIHVHDVADAVASVISVSTMTDLPPVLNIGTGVGITINALAGLICTALKTDASINHAPARPGDVRHSVARNQLAIGALGIWRPTRTIHDFLFSEVNNYES